MVMPWIDAGLDVEVSPPAAVLDVQLRRHHDLVAISPLGLNQHALPS
jgi:hypothetical protein